MILIYSNKPHMGLRVVEAIGSDIKEAYPNEKIVVINQLFFKNLEFEYPQNLEWSDYPYVNEPIYKFNITNWSKWKPCEITDENTLVSTHITLEEVKEVKTIIYADDPFNSNCHNFDLFIQHFFAGKSVDTPAIVAMSLDKVHLQQAWKNRSDFYETFRLSVNESIVKRYFNYNYNINSVGIFGVTLKELRINNDYISKYMLQLLYKFRQLNNQKKEIKGYLRGKTEGKIVNLMINWIGTGKYIRTEKYKCRLGSEMSMATIMENLIKMGLTEIINNNGRNEIQISQLGDFFLSKLHRDCLDKDLPFKYDIWQNEDVELAKENITKYLEDFFGKQKRKLDNHE